MEKPNGKDPEVEQSTLQDDEGDLIISVSQKEMSVIERLKAPTPKFFKKLRTIGLILAAAGGALVTAPVMLPTIVVTVGGYLLVAGGVASAVSQATIEGCEVIRFDKKKG